MTTESTGKIEGATLTPSAPYPIASRSSHLTVKEGMTFGELASFVEQCKGAAMKPTAKVTVRVKFGGQIKSITVGE